jgi:hypothetical protein
MTHSAATIAFSRARLAKIARRAVLGLVGSAAFACNDIPVKNEFAPAGNISGTLVYTGPLPCTQGLRNPDTGAMTYHVLGSAEILIFSTELLPPPDGLATTARTLATVSGDVLFDSLQGALSINDDGSIWCPAPGGPHITVSAPWIIGPLQPGEYQVRGFYDYDGDFSPVLRLHNLPTAGDVGGGALANPIEAALGEKPRYQAIQVGQKDANGHFSFPRDADGNAVGALVEGVAINLGKILPYSRPIAHFDSVKDERPAADPALLNTNVRHLSIPRDQKLSLAPQIPQNISKADREFIRLVLKASLPGSCEGATSIDECSGEMREAAKSPFSLQTAPPYTAFYIYPNKEDNGDIKTIPEKAATPVADLFPNVIFSRLNPADPTNRTTYSRPANIISGLVVAEDTVVKSLASAWKGRTEPTISDHLTVNVRPSQICINPLDPESLAYVVTPSIRAANNEPIIEDVEDLKKKIGKKVHRDPSRVRLIQGCLAPGRFATNLVYDTGQAWTIPNEAGACVPPLEVAVGTTATGTPEHCQQRGQPQRTVLQSQTTTIFVGQADDEGFCNTVSTLGADCTNADGTNCTDVIPPEDYILGVPRFCLDPGETAESLRALIEKFNAMKSQP